ncbi:hypothetical protein [Coxiella burnetii]|uniref:hypothetical protein n=1 Tax=Coxiella burnetii TaxID=777 RepID=UPI000161024C|nr:hypothetical protein [Coxiella burnetii]ABX78288.1 hypothetical protein COXBURSA331_A0890 [Coxiella burnetii RSA 331]
MDPLLKNGVIMRQHRISIFKKRRRSMKDIKILGVDVELAMVSLCRTFLFLFS